MAASSSSEGLAIVPGSDHERLPISEEIEDRLAAAQASTPLLSAWDSRGRSAKAGQEGLGGAPAEQERGGPGLPAEARQTVLYLTAELAASAGLPGSAWFQAARLLDASAAALAPSGGQQGLVKALPALCVAIVNLLRKTEDAGNRVKDLDLSALANPVALQLHARGFEVPEKLTHQDVLVQESKMLQALGFHVFLPSVETWITLLGARLRVLMHETFAELITWVTDQSIFVARFLTMWSTQAGCGRAKALACGFVGIHLVLGSMLPLEVLRPRHVQAGEWERLFLESQPQVGAVPQTNLPEESVQVVHHALLRATNSSPEALRQASLFTVGRLLAALALARQ